MTTTTTLRRIRACSPCRPSWRRLCRAVGGMPSYGLDTPLPLTRILDALGLTNATWACRTLDADDLPRLAEFAQRVAQRVEHLGGTAAEPASDYAAEAVARRAYAACFAAADAASADYAARAADAAAVGAAAAAADAAAAATACAAAAAYAAAEAAAAAADAAERAAQIEIFREIFG